MNHIRKSNSKLLTAFLSALTFIWVFPFLYVIFNSLKSGSEYNLGNFWDLPKGFEALPETINYMFDRISILSGFINSLIYGISGGAFAILISALAAYGLARLPIKGKLYWFFLIYSGTIFPFQMYLVPIYQGYLKLNLYDTQTGMILFYMAISIPFCTFVLRNFFLSVSKDISDASRIDGAGDFKVFYKIYLPMARAPISALFLFQFTFIWNDLLFGLTFSQSESVRPIMPLLASLTGPGGITSNVPAMLLACLIASIPTVFIYFALNKNFEKGFILESK